MHGQCDHVGPLPPLCPRLLDLAEVYTSGFGSGTLLAP